MSMVKLFLLCLLGHFLSDFTLQGILAQMKQEQWWRDEIYKWNQTHRGNSSLDYSKYEYDWLCALNTHSCYWAILTFLPLLFITMNDTFIVLVVLINGILHSIIDHMKCNLNKINLCTDQLFHIVQILATVIIAKLIFQ